MKRLALVLAVLAGGCSTAEPRRSADACFESPDDVVAAVRSAPEPTPLPDGSTLSDCVGGAVRESDLGNVGSAFTEAASRLAREARTDPQAGLQLGFLIGATERGAKQTSGIQDELAYRMRNFLDDPDVPASSRRAAARGRAAGRLSG